MTKRQTGRNRVGWSRCGVAFLPNGGQTGRQHLMSVSAIDKSRQRVCTQHTHTPGTLEAIVNIPRCRDNEAPGGQTQDRPARRHPPPPPRLWPVAPAAAATAATTTMMTALGLFFPIFIPKHVVLDSTVSATWQLFWLVPQHYFMHRSVSAMSFCCLRRGGPTGHRRRWKTPSTTF